MEHEVPQQPELGSGELEARAAGGQALRVFIEAQPRRGQRTGAEAAAALQDRADARQQFRGMERLADIVVGAAPEALDALLPAPARREDDDRNPVASTAPVAEDLQSRAPGQAEVEHHQVVGLDIAEHLGLEAIGGQVDRIAATLQRPLELRSERGIVLDHQEPHRQSSISILIRLPVRASSLSSQTCPRSSRISTSYT
jgi:hypothetical protein